MATRLVLPTQHLTISRTANRKVTLTYCTRNTRNDRHTVTETFTYDLDELRDSEALHTVLTIRDPGDDYRVTFATHAKHRS